jgi:hypothetical protein
MFFVFVCFTDFRGYDSVSVEQDEMEWQSSFVFLYKSRFLFLRYTSSRLQFQRMVNYFILCLLFVHERRSYKSPAEEMVGGVRVT